MRTQKENQMTKGLENSLMSRSEWAALEVLRSTGKEVLEAALVAKAALKSGHGSVKRAYECLAIGEEELRQRRKTVTFRKAVEEALHERVGTRRKRTVNDLRYLTRRFMTRCPELAQRRVRTVRPEECAIWIKKAFDTPSQRKKARAALSCVFSTAIRHGWRADNPVRLVQPPLVREKRICVLTREETERLLSAAAEYRNGICLPATAVMLYAGVRPNEVARLTWEQVHMKAGVISILPEHSKTGGSRHVTIQPELARVLARSWRHTKPRASQKICPRNWTRHWTQLHREAGWDARQHKPWQPDVLRHTFATRHLKTHRSYTLLQYEMGHCSNNLLRTRYIAL